MDTSQAPPEPWWDFAYAHKRPLIILNNDSQTLPTGYSVLLHFDDTTTPTAAEVYADFELANKGDDIRIVYQNTTEVPRLAQVFQSDEIDIWFKLQTSLAPGHRQQQLPALLRQPGCGPSGHDHF